MLLTEKQQAILDFINEYVGENGFPPSVREIGRRFGIYPATVHGFAVPGSAKPSTSAV